MGMEQPQGVLLSGAVIAQHQVQLEVLPPAPCNGGDGVVGGVGLRKDVNAFVTVVPPGRKYPVRQLHHGLPVGAAQTDDRHGPVQNAGLYALKAPEADLLPHACPGHGQLLRAPLEVVVGEYGAAHNGQVRV